ncbi:MAG: hypothetical protein AAGC55_21965 [Myxococcota bacterium]
MPANILTANRSNITIDGTVIEGIQSITYRETRDQTDIMALGSDERIDVAYGAVRVSGSIVVASADATLAQHLAEKSSFQIVANLTKEFGVNTESSQTVTFDNCFLYDVSFSISANGTGMSTYEFSATRVTIA